MAGRVAPCYQVPGRIAGHQMSAPVFVGSSFVAKYPTGGGSFWVPLQYLLGLRAAGVEAYWLELLWGKPDLAAAREFAASFRADVERLGVAAWVALVLFPDDARNDPPGRAEHMGLGADDLWARARDGVLLNFADSVPSPLRSRFGRTVLVDIDPGQFQVWAQQHDLGVGSHDLYLTIGQNLGAPDCPVPLGGIPWQKIWPSVHLPAWPVAAGGPGARYTTVTQWWSGSWVVMDGEVLNGDKRTAFLEVLELPERVPVALELAANIHPGETDELARLRGHGWHLADPIVAAGSPEAFRRYVQASRGEFSCAKPTYVRTRPGWVSDRTVCYLASGRPCVVQATGAEGLLPASPGLQFFRNVDEAAAGLRAIEQDYGAASRAARALAEEVFATRVVVPTLLRAIGLR
jgi:hypothetical protein